MNLSIMVVYSSISLKLLLNDNNNHDQVYNS